MRFRFVVAALAIAAAAIPGIVHAAVTVATLGTGPGTYTVNVAADTGTYRITLATTGDPITTGGCANNYVRTRRGHYVNGVTCTTAGTIQFSTSVFVACETPLALTQDGVVVASWLLNAPCPPPAPPAVVVTYGAGTATFDNTAATVDQQAVFSVGIPNGTTSCTASIPAHLTTHFAGITIKYVYLTLDGVDYVHIPAGQTVVVTWSCT